MLPWNLDAISLFATIAAVALGIFVVASPARAADIWGRKQLDKLPPDQRASYLRVYRVFGVVLCVAGALAALESVELAKYHR